ncbi:hypothetical protein XarjCFBP7645_02955 [Xanthomonas arboricola]|uniref:Uncharacterized protein n=1 Tax=Xanthomonas arboricola TaxID=56448 RepID=A0A2S7AHC0_9XANT|nr:hypothetical protein XarjCFBP7645_02955 [Xanthomonas arboricola]
MDALILINPSAQRRCRSCVDASKRGCEQGAGTDTSNPRRAGDRTGALRRICHAMRLARGAPEE